MGCLTGSGIVAAGAIRTRSTSEMASWFPTEAMAGDNQDTSPFYIGVYAGQSE